MNLEAFLCRPFLALFAMSSFVHQLGMGLEDAKVLLFCWLVAHLPVDVCWPLGDGEQVLVLEAILTTAVAIAQNTSKFCL